MYFLMVALWIPNSRSIARSDTPLAHGFLNCLPSLLLQEGWFARGDSCGRQGSGRTAGHARLILLVRCP